MVHSVVTELIGEQCQLPAFSFPALSEASQAPSQEGILVFDASTPSDLLETGKKLAEADMLSIMAGCAGFGAVLPELLDIAPDRLALSQSWIRDFWLSAEASIPSPWRSWIGQKKAGFSRAPA